MNPRRAAILGLLVLLAIAVAIVLQQRRPADEAVKADAPPAASAQTLATPDADSTPTAPAAVPAMPRAIAAVPARPGARRVPTAADMLKTDGRPPAAMALPADFLDKLTDASGKRASFTLPDGRAASGTVEWLKRDAEGVLLVQGRLDLPETGFYYFERQTAPGVAGAMVGNVRFDKSNTAFRVDPAGAGGTPMLVEHSLDQVVCVNLTKPDPVAAEEPQNAPQTHPTNIPIPTYQNGVVPLQSLPGAAGVIYLDFDGETGPFAGWGSFDAAPSGATNAQIKDVWQRVAEDYQPFNLNVTTDRRVFDTAAENSRMHVILTPTTTAAPGAGGVAYVGSFNSTGDTVCWSFYSTGKSAAEVVSHEVGHTLGLSHDGRNTPSEGYYGGHGSGETGWAPIMGVGYYQNLVQWSKGEYTSANNTEDDLSIITNNNNSVAYRADDYGATFATAGYLEILANNSVSNEGIIETSTDFDAFRFTTAGGAVSLTVSVVSASPNLDILAEIFTSAGVLVATANPDAALSATVAATLAAGDYTLRVSGVGRGDPLVDGYTAYDSLGAYLITGTVAGGVKPDRFTIAENTANGTAVGTVVPRNSHGANPLAFAITSGNGTGAGAFALNASTGTLTVADVAQMNYEALSLRWDDLATFELFVSITDATNPTLNETVRVVVTVTDVNEPPTVSGGSATMLEHTQTGTKILKVTGSDPDRFEFPVFSITAGNTGGAFAIDASTGQITVAADTTAATQSVYNLTVQVADHGTPVLTATAAVTITVIAIPAGYTPGKIVRTYFENIGNGTLVSNLTGNAKFPNNPDSQEFLTAFDGGAHGDNFGSTVRGYVIPPTTGSYTFWIASDDSSELRISTNATPASAVVKGTVSGYTDQYQWTKFSSQTSAAVTLTAGSAYYIEARHKEGGGGDHVAVAWQGPGITRQAIPGAYLSPFYQNYAPKVVASTFTVREGSYNGAAVGTVQVTDVNAQDTSGSYLITGGTGVGVFAINSATGAITVTNGAVLNATTTPSYTLTIQTTDNGTPAMNGTGTVTVSVLAAATINVTGIVQQFWNNISGNNVSVLTGDSRYPNSPSSSRVLTSFDSGSDFADNYGSRIRAYVVPPTTGSYTFYIATDDEGQLRFSTDATPANATQIANATNATGRSNWTSNASQISAAFTLTAGQRYYIETLQKEGVGGDYVQVAWTGPGIATQTIIPGSALQPFDVNVAPAFTGAPYAFTIGGTAANGTAVGTVAATDPNGDPVIYGIVSGNPGGNAFAINPQTGAITVSNSAALPAGQVAALQVGTQDNGGGLYPLKTVTTTVSITVGQAISLASPTTANVTIPAGVGLSLLADNAGRTTTTIAWTKFSGTGAVTFGSPAALATSATFSTNGSYVLRCTETSGASSTSFDVSVNVGVVIPTLTGTKVGTQAVTPGHSVAAGVYTISAAGSGIPSSGTPDDFYFVNIPASGSVTITARVRSVEAVNGSNSRAGVMIRESAAADARSVFCGVTSQNSGRFIYRATAATNAANSTGTAVQPCWVRITRSGNTFTAQIAPDSSGSPGTFATIGSAQTIAMSTNALVGLAATSGSTSAAGTTIIENVTISPTPINIGASVDAGPDATITLPSTATLSGTMSDDGKPAPPAAVTTAWTKLSGPGSVTFGNSSAVGTTASFTAAGAYVLRLTADDGEVKTFDDVALAVQPTPFEQWQQTYFGSNPTPGIAGPNDNPDKDAYVNLVEYALGLDPLTPSTGGMVTDMTTIGADKFLRLTVTRNSAATDVTFSIEVTGDLATPASWSTIGTTVETNTSTLLRVRDNTPVGSAGNRQIRLRVTRP